MSEASQLPPNTPPVPRLAASRKWHPLPTWFRSAAAMQDGSVLLETAKFDADNFRSLLFTAPARELTAWTAGEVEAVFQAADRHLRQGNFVAGFVSYECGEVLQGIAPRPLQAAQNVPLIRMGVFGPPAVFDHKTGRVEGKQPAADAHDTARLPQPAAVLQADLQIAPAEYERQIRIIQDYLAAGHSYQVNFTGKVLGTFTGTPLGLYEQVLSQQPVSYASFVNLGEQQVLSFSPELFYRVDEGKIHVRPMKGTWPRGRNNLEDEEAARGLRCDAKNRAEHITIVDLLRNDLGRICRPGTVQVDALMQVERYRTLHQMTSNISGTLQPHLTAGEVFQAIFPSGSITGAPKLRTMEIIQETEKENRGVYTGSIGYFGPHGEACFNVAIRTLLVRNNIFTLGVGGGITLDSTPCSEYQECRLKACFLTKREPEFYLFETMRAVDGVIPRLDAHLQRLRDSAAYFGFSLEEESIRHGIGERLAGHGRADGRVRLSLQRDGQCSIEATSLEVAQWPGRVLLWPEAVQSSNVFLQHKTSYRELYRQAFLQAQRQGYDEVLFQNEDGLVTEGSIGNLFAAIDERTVTPKTSCGALPGVERAHILESFPDVQVGTLALEELRAADALWLSNALRGVRPIATVHDAAGNLIWQQRCADPAGESFPQIPGARCSDAAK